MQLLYVNLERIQYPYMTATNVNLFGFHKLNTQGQQKALAIADVFENALAGLESICPVATREFSITKTKMEEACFFAKKAMAVQPENQE